MYDAITCARQALFNAAEAAERKRRQAQAADLEAAADALASVIAALHDAEDIVIAAMARVPEELRR